MNEVDGNKTIDDTGTVMITLTITCNVNSQ